MLAEINFVAVFQRAHQLHAIEGREVEFIFQICVLISSRSANFGKQFAERTGATLHSRGRLCHTTLGNLLHFRDADFLCGRAWEIGLRPDEPVTNLLMLRQFGVGAGDRSRNVRRRNPRDDGGRRLCISVSCECDYRAIAHFGLAAQRGFQIFRINIQPGGRNDHLLAASLEI